MRSCRHHVVSHNETSLPGKCFDRPALYVLKSWIITLFLINIFFAGTSQSGHHLSAVYTRMGAYSKNFVNPLSGKANIAALASIQSLSGAVYGERKYLINELNHYTLAFCFPFHGGVMAASADYSGYKDYNETQIGIGYIKSLGKIDIGVRFNLYSIRITGYGNSAVFNVEAGAMFHLSERLYAGVHTFNPTRSSLGNNSERLPSAFSAGVGYECSKLVLLQAEAIKQENKPVTIHAGIQYIFAGKVIFRFGVHGENANLYVGTGLHRKSIRFDINCGYHSKLGFTPGLFLVFQKPAQE